MSVSRPFIERPVATTLLMLALLLAGILSYRALPVAALPQVDEARLQLSYTRITAPISGRTGLRRVDPGNLISANDANGIVTLTQTQPVSVLLTIPETDLQSVRAGIAQRGSLPVEAWDREGRT